MGERSEEEAAKLAQLEEEAKERQVAVTGLVISVVLISCLLLPLLLTVAGFAVRCFMWAAGLKPFVP